MGKTHRKLLKRPLRLHKLSLGQQPQSRPHGLVVTRGKSGQQKYCRLMSRHAISLQTRTPRRVTTSRVVTGSFTMARECVEWLPMDHPKEQHEGTGLVWAVHCSAADLRYGSAAPRHCSYPFPWAAVIVVSPHGELVQGTALLTTPFCK